MQILIHTPIWVWPIMFGLIALGLNARRTRIAPVWVFATPPLLGVMSVSTIAALPAPTLVWSCFAATYALGAIYGYRKQPAWTGEITGGKVHLKGEWLSLICFMTIFFSRFVQGYSESQAPQIVDTTLYLALFTAANGAPAGILFGRAFYVVSKAKGRVRDVNTSAS